MSIIKSGTTSTTAYQVEGNTNGDLVFQTNGTTTAMTINTSQNVGIGTSSPSQKLEVAGAAKLTGTNLAIVPSTTTSAAYLVNTNAGGNFFVGIDNSTGGSFGAGAYGRILYSGGAYPIAFFTNDTERMRLDSSGNLLVGTTTANGKISLYGTAASTAVSIDGTGRYKQFEAYSSGTRRFFTGFDETSLIGSMQTDGAHPLAFYTNGNERARITSGGDVLIGTTTATSALTVERGANNATNGLSLANNNEGEGYGSAVSFYGAFGAPSATNQLIARISGFVTGPTSTKGGIIAFSTGTGGSVSERARITSGGDLQVGTTNGDPVTANVTGHVIYAGGAVQHSRDGDNVLFINRKSTDGNLVQFYQDGTIEGSISVSGNTVSYNAFAGSHWSQLQDGGKPDILRGTVMESINELCEWPDETNERLPKSKISDTAGSKKVYGVFMAWDNDWTETNDMYVTAVGAFICRVNGSVTVQEGDLLESNGDGTARVQADDIIRSSTIGKVTSTVKTHEYDDGSYCVPTVLYCG